MDAAHARLVRVPLDPRPTPWQALRALADEPWPFALAGRWAGGGAIVGARPLRVAAPDEDPFALLDALPTVAVDDDAAPTEARGAGSCAKAGTSAAGHGAGGSDDRRDDDEPVGGGWFGWLGFGLGARIERLPPQPPAPAPAPPFQLAYYDHVLRLDRRGRWWFEALQTPARAAVLARRRDELAARLAAAAALPPTAPPAPPPFRIAGPGAAGHRAAVRACRERIAAGEIFQANLCLRLETAWDGSLAELFAHAAERLRPAFAAAFPTPDGGVASLSPELFLRRRGRLVETGPIKGTIARPRGADDAADALARAALAGSVKDHAEHVMIVDLMRNDLGRVAAYGSVVAPDAPELEPHPGLWHLVSRVRARLRDDATDADLLRATFPPGSVTGAPKVQALHVISELEATAREAYTGAVGFASPLAGLGLNVAIRTFEARAGRLWLGVGGGIVADSDPHAELEECLVKARPLVAAIGGTIAAPERSGPTEAPAVLPHRATAPGAPRRPLYDAADAGPPRGTPATGRPPGASAPPPALGRGRRRPDPRKGIFETLLVRDGAAVRAREHLARLAASAAALYDLTLPDDLAARIAAAAAELSGPAALRVVVTPRARGAADVAVEPGTPRTRPLPIALRPYALPGGLGAHKWLDRSLLDALARERPDATPLLVDGDGAVLEAAWGNVMALAGDTLVTPPADGRILPGVTRAAALAAAPRLGLTAREEPLSLARLAAADAVLVSSALAVVVPAILIADAPHATAGNAHAADYARDLAQRLTAAIEQDATATVG